MNKRYRGFCPPFIAIGLVVLFLILNLLTTVAGATDVIPGSEDAPPGGQWPATQAEDGSQGQQPGEGGQDVAAGSETTLSPTQTNPEQGAGTPIEQGQLNQPTVEPSAEPTEPEPSEPAIREDPVGRYPARVDTQGIKIVSPSIDELIAEGADIEALLYPSGLQLPTKYMDLLMLAPMNSSSTIVGETVNFLKTVAPNATSTYTFAEYEAADVYLAICRLCMQEEGTSATGDALKLLDSNTTVNWTTNITNATIVDKSRLAALLTNYKDILEKFGEGVTIGTHRQFKDLVGNHKDVYYSAGDLTYYSSIADGSSFNDESMSAYTMNLYSTWDYLGVTHSITANIIEYSHYYNEFAYNGVNYNRGAPVSSFAPTTEGEQPPQQVGLGNMPNDQVTDNPTTVQGPSYNELGGDNIVSGTSGQEWMQGDTQGSGDTPVSNVGSSTGGDSGVLPDGRRNLQDIASIVALVFVVIGVTVVWGIHTYRKGHDPLSRWK